MCPLWHSDMQYNNHSIRLIHTPCTHEVHLVLEYYRTGIRIYVYTNNICSCSVILLYTCIHHLTYRSNTAAIVVFQLSLASDIHNLFVSITEPSPSVPVTKGTLLHVTNDYQHEAISAGPLPSKKEVVVSLEVKDTH